MGRARMSLYFVLRLLPCKQIVGNATRHSSSGNTVEETFYSTKRTSHISFLLSPLPGLFFDCVYIAVRVSF